MKLVKEGLFMTEINKEGYGADLIVDSLINHDVNYVFGTPWCKN